MSQIKDLADIQLMLINGEIEEAKMLFDAIAAEQGLEMQEAPFETMRALAAISVAIKEGESDDAEGYRERLIEVGFALGVKYGVATVVGESDEAEKNEVCSSELPLV